MLLHLHSQATTTPKARATIQASDEPVSFLTERFGVIEQTVYKWRKRDSVEDCSQLPESANATSNAVAIPGAWHMSAGELHARYRETGETSDKESLVTTELEEQINYLYRADISAFRHLFVMENM